MFVASIWFTGLLMSMSVPFIIRDLTWVRMKKIAIPVSHK
jgi:hypothetical protein